MKTETEVKFIDIDIREVRRKLKEIGADCTLPMRSMKRAIIDYEDERLQKNDGYIRVRDEGDKITLTYKKFESLDFGGAKEHEVVVSNFQTTVDILTSTDLVVRSLQETKRETWTLNGVEIVIDEWPWLNTYIEVEGEDEEEIKDTAKKLGFSWSEAVFGDVMVVYRAQYPKLQKNWSIGRLANVTFDMPPPSDLQG